MTATFKKLFEQYMQNIETSKCNISLLGFLNYCLILNKISLSDRRHFYQAYKEGLISLRNNKQKKKIKY